MKHLNHFSTHIFSHAILLVIITSVAVGLHYVIQWGEAMLNRYIVFGIRVCEYGLFVADILLFMMNLLKAFKKHAFEIWKS